MSVIIGICPKGHIMLRKMRAIITALSIMAFVISLAWNIFPVNLTSGLAFAVILLFVNWVISEIELFKIKSTSPNLVFTEPYIKQYPMTVFHQIIDDNQSLVAGTDTITSSYVHRLRIMDSTGDYLTDTESYLIVFASVENKKEGKKEVVTSLNTHAEIDFYKEDFSVIKTGVNARWADTIEPSYAWLQPTIEKIYLQKDIPAGITEKLCLVTRRENGGNCYIFNRETYQKSKVESNDLLIGKGTFFVRITVRNANPTNDLEGWFEIINPGEEGVLQIRRIEKPSIFKHSVR